MLKVYKASAGSGKTFQLVVDYLKLLLQKPGNYKHILAVTFTNKATNEMKSRILEQLHLISTGQPSKYLDELAKNSELNEESIRKNSGIILQNILHDFNRFSVNTIDSFTQKVIKSFNREIGITPNYGLELDSKMVLAEATDRLLLKIGNDPDLFKWLKEFSKEKINENRSHRLDYDIKKLGEELFKEKFQVFFPEDSKTVYDKKKLTEFSKNLKKQKKEFETTLKKLGAKGIRLIKSFNLELDDFSGKKRSAANTFFKAANGNTDIINKTALAAKKDAEKWVTKNHPRKEFILEKVASDLQPLLIDLLTFYETESKKYNTTIAVLNQLRTLGILTDLKEEIQLLMHEKGLLQLSDSNLLLNKIIGNADAPFVYEKTGTFYKHFMLDEFQDTSGLQWNNFKPLIINSLSEGNKNLLVGDVKQSIYRWRNSDWTILANQIHTDFPGQINETPLNFNWRSDKNIIDFNSAVFENLKATFKSHLFGDFGENSEQYQNRFDLVYTDFEQKTGKKDAPQTGYISVSCIDSDDFEATSVKKLVEQVKNLQDKGIKASETAILIRKNKEGIPIIEEFLKAAKLPENKDYNLTVLSNESMFLKASKAVRFVIGVITFFIAPDNQVNIASLLHLWNSWLQPNLADMGKNGKQKEFTKNQHCSIDSSFKSNFEEELAAKIEKLKTKILHTSLDETVTVICSDFGLFDFENELPFLQTLIDKAAELKTSLSNDLSNFIYWWIEKGTSVSVYINENIDSVRLLTVHKSKGLEFKAVLLPFFNWKTSDSFAPILWCKPQSPPYNEFPLLPVKSGKKLIDTEFKSEYFDEKLNYYIDVFNLIYVAFTRAKSVLIIHSQQKKSAQKGNSQKNSSDLLTIALDNLNNSPTFKNCWNAEKTEFVFGSIAPSPEKEITTTSQKITKYIFTPFTEKLKLRFTADGFITETENHTSVKNLGKIIHEILAGIEVSSDIEKACLNEFRSGKINRNELNEIRERIKNSINQPEVKPWFDGSYKVFNETDLLTPDKILRPDRIMIKDEQAIIVDYKTGEKKSDNYHYQVKRYAKTLKELGFEKVEGYLWYLTLNDVEKVCEL